MQKFEEIKKLLANSTIYYLIAIDMNSNYSYVNPRYAHIFEPVNGNLVGQHYSVTMHPDDLEICGIVAMKAFSAPEEIFPAVIRKHDGKGGYVITSWEFKAMFNADHQPEGIFCIGHDITEFMQTTMALKDTKEDLSKVKFTLDQIAYVQSHVVRKPIANLVGLSSLLDNMEVSDELKHIVKMIHQSALELDEVIRETAADESSK